MYVFWFRSSSNEHRATKKLKVPCTIEKNSIRNTGIAVTNVTKRRHVYECLSGARSLKKDAKRWKTTPGTKWTSTTRTKVNVERVSQMVRV